MLCVSTHLPYFLKAVAISLSSLICQTHLHLSVASLAASSCPASSSIQVQTSSYNTLFGHNLPLLQLRRHRKRSQQFACFPDINTMSNESKLLPPPATLLTTPMKILPTRAYLLLASIIAGSVSNCLLLPPNRMQDHLMRLLMNLNPNSCKSLPSRPSANQYSTRTRTHCRR